RCFKRAVECGINFFDTADMYSVGASEEVTGRAVKEFCRLEECVVATKVFNAMSDRPNMAGLSRKHVVQGCEASLRRLGEETIDLYQVHRVDPRTPIDEMLSALDLPGRQGKGKYIGARSTAPWRFALALSASDRNGWARFVTMQNHYNLIYREEEREMIPLCEAEGVATLPWSPLARGLLAGTRKTPTDATATRRAESDDFARKLYDQPSDQAVIDAVRGVAQARGIPPAQIALAWLLPKPTVAAPLIGATKMHHFDDAIAALGVQLTDDEVKKLEAPYRPHPVRGF